MTLEEVRTNARKKLKGICGVYQDCDGIAARRCQEHSYGSPIGIGAAGTGSSFANNVKALAALVKILQRRYQLSGPGDDGATLANEGVNPVTGVQALKTRYVRDLLTVMYTCGMYDFAGEWAYNVGLPAKNGVSGCVLGVVPGQMGIAVFCPPLDHRGNSTRAIKVFEDFIATGKAIFQRHYKGYRSS